MHSLEKEAALTAEKLRSILDLDEETGILRWRENPERSRAWNSRHTGKAAGCIANGYVQIRIDDCLYQGHRLVWLHVYGEWPANELDHKNRVRSDNRISNIRHATHGENCRNRPIQKNNQSGFKGVRWRDHHKKWEGRISKDGKVVWREYFDDPQTAAAARRIALDRLHEEFAHHG